jgi:hypothetical protein
MAVARGLFGSMLGTVALLAMLAVVAGMVPVH